MAHKKTIDPAGTSGQKPQAAKRTVNPPGNAGTSAPADQQQDAKNRKGSFEGKGDHARTGNRGHQ